MCPRPEVPAHINRIPMAAAGTNAGQADAGEGHELARIRGMPLRHEAETAGGEARLIRRDSDAEASPKASPNASPNANDAAKGGRGRDSKGLGGRVSSTAGAGAAGMRGNYSAAGQAGKSSGAGTPTPRQRARSLSSDAKGIVTCGVFPSSAAPSCACLCVFFGPLMFLQTQLRLQVHHLGGRLCWSLVGASFSPSLSLSPSCQPVSLMPINVQCEQHATCPHYEHEPDRSAAARCQTRQGKDRGPQGRRRRCCRRGRPQV